MAVVFKFPADRIVRRPPHTAAATATPAAEPAVEAEEAPIVLETTADGRRYLGPRFDGLLHRWYWDPRDVQLTNQLIDQVFTAFETWRCDGTQPQTRGWCEYQHQLYELMTSTSKRRSAV